MTGLVSCETQIGTDSPLSQFFEQEVSLSSTSLDTLPIIDYEGSPYRTEFWEGQGREYEDQTERIALSQLLPPTGDTLLEVGAGFGRLAALYAGYRQVILMDYSLSLLQEAKRTWGQDPRFVFVAASAYGIPIVDSRIDSAVMIRVMHHLKSPKAALAELHRVTQGRGALIIEYANKRNLKAIGRYLLRQQKWSPFDPEPYEFVPLNFDFHPQWMTQTIKSAGIDIEQERAISIFRSQSLKRRVPARTLAQIDNRIAGLSAKFKLSPSILVRGRNHKNPESSSGLLRCPQCHGTHLDLSETIIECTDCKKRWSYSDGIYDFRAPLPE